MRELNKDMNANKIKRIEPIESNILLNEIFIEIRLV